MAWRIDSNVRRGEIDNRTKGSVKGRIWLHGVRAPIGLEFAGNACPDLAGCLLEFKNREATSPLPRDRRLASRLQGVVGDLTASRKVRLADEDEEGFPVATDSWGNALYLEWFTPDHGRMVIESTAFRLRVSAPEWVLSPAEETVRKLGSEQAFLHFLGGLDDALAKAEAQTPSVDKPDWDEFDYEKLLRESDARTDKYSALLDRYLDHPERDAIVGRFMGWNEATPGSPTGGDEDWDESEATHLDDAMRHALDEAAALAADEEAEPDPSTEGQDWVRAADGALSHPLSLRAFDSSMRLWRAVHSTPAGAAVAPDLDELVSEFQTTTAKIAGALDSLAYGRDHEHGPFIVATLKRALSHLHRSQAALERATPRRLLSPQAFVTARTELFDIREEILRLMQEFRSGDA